MQKEKVIIVVGIPTYNEADSIRKVVQKIDTGLSKYFPGFNSLIVNIDSDSDDDTKNIFLTTKTKTKKYFIRGGKSPRGKGLNLLKLFRFSKEVDAEYIAIFDADVLTIQEDWVWLLLNPIIKQNLDLTIPIYTRNRYEGNTTNHFCYPLIGAWFGKTIRQSIAGEYGMSRKFINYILAQKIPSSAELYGIDIFLTIHALGGDFNIKEVELGRKIHKPSFNKIIPMFQQVATTSLYVLSNYKNRYYPINFNRIKGKVIQEQQKWVDKFVKKPTKRDITEIEKYASVGLSKIPISKIEKYTELSKKEIKEILNKKLPIHANYWVKILKSTIDYIFEHNISEEKTKLITKIILPFFLLRVVCYFKEINKKPVCIVEKIVKNQLDQLLRLYAER